jgi:hypothetical protein
MEHTIKDVKAGNCYKLIPYKYPYMLVASEHVGNVQYSVVNIELGLVAAEFPTLGKVCDFLNRWQAISTQVNFEVI